LRRSIFASMRAKTSMTMPRSGSAPFPVAIVPRRLWLVLARRENCTLTPI
jgi:hypothetical protein